MQWFRDRYLDKCDSAEPIRVLDLGSYCEGGDLLQTYQPLFSGAPFEYTGLDMVDGPNVDIVVEHPYHWSEVADKSYDAVISGQVFEHVEFAWLTLAEMARVVKPGGVICIICPSMSLYHRAPLNCQNYFSDGLVALSKYVGLETLHASTNYAPKGGVGWYDMYNQDSMLIARRPLDWKSIQFDPKTYTIDPLERAQTATELVPYHKQGLIVKCRVLFMVAFALPLRELRKRLLHPQRFM